MPGADVPPTAEGRDRSARRPEASTDATFRALADPTRRRLLDSLHERDGQTLLELCVGVHMSRQAVSKHLRILEEALLVSASRRGRHRVHHLNAAPIADIGERWIHRYQRARIDLLSDLRHALEERSMATPERTEFRYVTYIRTTPDHLWRALTDPAFTARWWEGTTLDTSWAEGAPMTWFHGDTTIAHPDQVVLEADPPRRLSYTWHTFSPQWATATGFDETGRAELDAEPRSRVTFDLAPEGESVKLTVTQGDLLPEGRIIQLVSQGWPRVLADLKTLVETADLAGA